MAKVSKIEQDGILYDVYDASALHGAEEASDLGVELIENKSQVINEDSTSDEYPSAAAVWDLFASLVDVNEEYF